MRGYITRDGGPLAGSPMELDWKSSFTQGLAAAWIFDERVIRERVRNILTAPSTSMNTGVALIQGGPDFLGQQRVGATFSAQLSGPTISNAMLGIGDQMSVVCLMRSTTTNKTAFCRPAEATHTSPFLDFGFFTNGDFRMSTAGSSVTPSCGFALNGSVWYLASITYDGATVRSRVGLAAPGTSALTGNVRDGGQEFLFGGSRDAAENFAGDQVYVGIWNRCLENGELTHLVAKPLAFMKPAPRFYFMQAGAQTVTVGLATETDTALPLDPADQIVSVGIATETDTAFVVSHLLLGIPEETDTALSCSPVRTKAVGLATETDSALAVTLSAGQTVEVGLVTETDSALAIGLLRLALASETDTAFPLQAIQTSYWPFDDLKPRHIGIHPVASPIGGGVALTGKEPTIDSGAGYWRIVYGGVPVKTRAQILKYRQLESLFEGRGRALLVYLFDGKRAPWVTVGTAISATANAAVAAGATSITILAPSIGTLKKGQHFSAGHYAYRIMSVSGPVANVYTCTIWPKTREAIASGAHLEFDHPVCRVRLQNDDGMRLPLQLHKFGDGNVEFVEDVP